MADAPAQLPGLADHPDSRGVFVELWVLDLCGGDYPIAVLLSQLLWWHQPGKGGDSKLPFQRDGHRWLVRKEDAWHRDTRLSAKQVRRCREWLVDRGVVEVRRFKIAGAPVACWRPCYEVLQAALNGQLPIAVGGDSAPPGKLDSAPQGTIHGFGPPGQNGFGPPGQNPSSLLNTSGSDTSVTPIAAPAAIAIQPRQRDLAFEALCHVCGIDWSQLTDTERRRTNAALAQIVKAWAGTVDALAEEIPRRARHYLDAFTTSLTPMALAGRWAQLANPLPAGQGGQLTGADRGLPAAQRWASRREQRP